MFLRKTSAGILAGIITVLGGNAGENKSDGGVVNMKRSEIPRIESAKKFEINGRLDNANWDKAVSLDGFSILGKPSEAPANSTELKAFYDVDALFLGFIFHEKNMSKIIRGLPAGQTIDTPISSNDDCGEILITTKDASRRYYHLRFTPSGAKDDAVCSTVEGKLFRDPSWNGDWSVRTHLGEDFWSAEVRIPFTMFAGEGEFAGTPAPGDTWPLNFCRVSSTTAEFTQWSPTVGGFHDPGHFGAFRFAGWSHGDISMGDVRTGGFIPGENLFSATLRNLSDRTASVTLTLTLTEDEDDPAEKESKIKKRHWEMPRKSTVVSKTDHTIPPQSAIVFETPYTIMLEGMKTLSAQIDWDRMKAGIFRGMAVKSVYPLSKNLDKLRGDLATMDGLSRGLPAGVREQHLDVVAQFAAALSQAAELSAKATSPESDFNARVAACEAASGKIAEARLLHTNSLHPYAWCLSHNFKKIDFCVGVANQLEKVFRDEAFTGSLAEEASLSLAGNEREGVQFVIIYLNDKVGDISFTCGDLKSDAGDVISSSSCSFDVVEYIDIGDTGRGTKKGAWPDVLRPADRVSQPSHKLQPVILTVKTDPAQRPGVYRGRAVFTGGGQEYPIKLAVNVFPFSLPERRSLKMNIWFWTYRPRTYYNIPGKDFFTLDLFTKFMELRGRYNFATGPRGDILPKLIRLRKDKEGRIEFDFSRIEPYFEVSVKNGANVLNLDLLNSAFFEKTKLELYDEASGVTSHFTAPDPKAMADQYFAEAVQFYKRKGWLDMAIIQVGDEPWSEGAQRKIREYVSWIRKIAPEVKTIAAGTVRNRGNLDGVIDIWCPQFRQYEAADYTGMGQAERLWFYQCLYKPLFPMYQIDRPGIEPRITGLICAKAGAEGFLYWSDTAWDDDKTRPLKLKDDNRWVNEKWLFPYRDMPGDGCFIYPDRERLLASFRAQAIRKCVDDYEYLSILRKSYESSLAKGALSPELKDKAERLLRIPDNIVQSCTSWTKSLDELEKFRLDVAAAIAELSRGPAAGSPASQPLAPLKK